MHEKPEFPIAVCYGQVLNAMYFASFYAPIIPIGVLFSILLLVALYWVYKVSNNPNFIRLLVQFITENLCPSFTKC